MFAETAKSRAAPISKRSSPACWGRRGAILISLSCDLPRMAVCSRLEGELCFKQFTGKESDLIRSVHRTGKAAHLDGDELGYLLAALAKIKAPGPNR